MTPTTADYIMAAMGEPTLDVCLSKWSQQQPSESLDDAINGHLSTLTSATGTTGDLWRELGRQGGYGTDIDNIQFNYWQAQAMLPLATKEPEDNDDFEIHYTE